MRVLRITFVLPGYPWRPVGGFRVVYEYANHLAARGHTVTVVHPRQLSNWPPEARHLRQRARGKALFWRDLILRPPVDWQPLDERVQMLYVPEPTAEHVPDGDAVFATAWQTAAYVAGYTASKGRKFYLVQDFYPYLGSESQIANTWRFPLRKVAVSSWLCGMVVQSGIAPHDISVIPNGVDQQRFRLQENISTRSRRIAMMYSDSDHKAAGDGVSALETCKCAHPDLQAIVFGAARRRPALPRWIEYAGRVAEERLVLIYNRSSIFLSSSIAEGFALPPAEAMACGCAVVATDSGGIREYARHEMTALLSPAGDRQALAANALRLLADDSLRIRLAQAGHSHIKKFTWEVATNKIEQLLLASA